MVTSARAGTADQVVDHFVHRFLRVPLAETDRAALVSFLRAQLGSSTIQPGTKLEDALRELLYLVLSKPEYHPG